LDEKGKKAAPDGEAEKTLPSRLPPGEQYPWKEAGMGWRGVPDCPGN